MSCLTMVHSRDMSSNLRSPSSLSTHIVLITFLYSTATLSISNIEFQRIDTSRGINRLGSLHSVTCRLYAGSKIVVKLTTFEAKVQIYSTRVKLVHRTDIVY